MGSSSIHINSSFTMTNKPGYKKTPAPGSTILVTGSSGFVGARLMEMLPFQRDASPKIILCFSFDIACLSLAPSLDLLVRGFLLEAASGDSSQFQIFAAGRAAKMNI